MLEPVGHKSRSTSLSPARKSVPVRERGSKPGLGQGGACRAGVAPRAGARIETGLESAGVTSARSLPAGSADRNCQIRTKSICVVRRFRGSVDRN